MPGFDVKVEGLDQLKAKLDQLARPKAQAMMNRATRAGGEVFQAEIEQRTPVRHDAPSGTALPPGALRNDISVKRVRDPGVGVSAVAVGPGRLTRHVMGWLEWGHNLVRKGKTVGFVGPQPIMRPALEGGKDAALAAVRASLQKDLANVNAISSGGEDG